MATVPPVGLEPYISGLRSRSFYPLNYMSMYRGILSDTPFLFYSCTDLCLYIYINSNYLVH